MANNNKPKVIKTVFGSLWVYTSVQRVVKPLRKKQHLKLIAALGAVVITVLTLIYAGFIDDRQGGKAFSGVGAGTVDDPFRISTCTQLQEIDNAVTNTHYILANDIDCSSTITWNGGLGFEPISPFSGGSLDGRNHTISGLYINRNTQYFLGLFETISSSTIKNLNLSGSVINNNTGGGSSEKVGGLAGEIYSYSTVISHVSTSVDVSGSGTVGGLAGTAYAATITNSSASGNVNVNGNWNTAAGGLIGYGGGTISDSFATGDVTLPANPYVYHCGGLIGQSWYDTTTIIRTYATGDVNCGNTGTNSAGGLLGGGTNSSTTISDSYATGLVTGRTVGNPNTGGLTGRDYGGGAYLNNYYDQTTTGQVVCDSYSTTACTAVNTINDAPDYFKNNTTNPPLDQWNFSTTWQATAGNPTLRAANISPEPPENLRSTVFGTTAILHWEVPLDDGGSPITDYLIYYKPQASSTWTLLDDGVSTSNSAVLPNLGTSTPYDVRVRAVNAIGNGLYSSIHQFISGGISSSPTVIDNGTTNVTEDSARLNGSVSPVGISQRGGNFGPTTTYGSTAQDINTYSQTYSFSNKWGSSGSGNGQFNLVTGMAIDKDGNIYTLDDNNRVQKFSSNGTYITKWGSSGSGNGQFNLPRGIAVDQSGNVYVADTYNHRIQKFNSSGTYLGQWGNYGTGNGQFNQPYGISTDSSGDVYVTDLLNSRVQVFSSNGVYIRQFGTSGSGNGQFNQANDLTIAFDYQMDKEVIYVGDTFNNRIQKFHLDGTYITKWGSSGSGNGQFNLPRGVSADPNGDIYVVDYLNYRIQKFSSSGSYITQFASSGSADGQISFTQKASIGPSGAVYVADTFNNRVQVFTGSSTILVDVNGLSCGTTYHYQLWATNEAGTGYSNDATFTTVACPPPPTVITLNTSKVTPNSTTLNGFSPSPGITVRGFEFGIDTNYGQTLQDISPSNYNYIDEWGSYGSGNGQFDSPFSSAVDSIGNIYVIDYGNYRIQKFDSNGNYMTQWGSYGSGNGQFMALRGIAISTTGNVYIASADGVSNHRIQKFDSNGNYMTQWGSYGSGNGQFNLPLGLATDQQDNVYVADSNNHRIQKFDSNGNYMTQWGSYGSGNGQFFSANDLAIDSSGNIYVADGNYRIQKFDSNGNYILQFGSAGYGNGQFYPFNNALAGIAIDSNNTIYVTDAGNHRIQAFNSNGSYVAQFGSFGNNDDQFFYPQDISIHPLSQKLIITDENNHRVKLHATPESITYNLTNLDCATTYHYRAYATNSNGTNYGNDATFTTSACPIYPPTIPQTLVTTDKTATTISLSWTAPNDDGGSPITDYLVEYKVSSANDWIPYPNVISTNLSEVIASLTPNTSYDFRVYAVNSQGSSQSSSVLTESTNALPVMDLELNTSLLNAGEIRAGDTVTYRNVARNNGPSSIYIPQNVATHFFILPVSGSFQAISAAIPFGCSDNTAPEDFIYFAQFYSGKTMLTCIFTQAITLNPGDSFSFDIITSATQNFSDGDTLRGYFLHPLPYIGPGATPYEPEEFESQNTVLLGIYESLSTNQLNQYSSQNIFTLPFNNASIASYMYTAPSSTPSPPVSPTDSPEPSLSPTAAPSPTIQPEPELPNPLFPKYPLETNRNPKKDTSPATAESGFLTGFVPAGVLNTIRLTPTPVALALPFFIILVLIALAALYVRQAWLEYRTIAMVRRVIERYHNTKEASQNFVALTSHYLNTPVNILQASAELLTSTKALSSANIDKLNLAIKNLAEDIKKLVTESQKTTSRVAESTTELDKLKMKNPLFSIFVLIPSGIVVLILLILNLLFTATDRYSLSFALVIAQITALILGIGILALSWHSFKRNQASRDALKHQLTLEADVLARRVAFITQSYSDLNADLGLVKALTKDIPKDNATQKPLQNGIIMLEKVLEKFNRLIHFSHPLETLPTLISIAPFINSALNSQKDTISQKTISVENQAPVGLTAPLTQEAAEQLMSSVLDNAIKFSKEGGNIKISTKHTKHGTMIIFQDNGVGIDKAKLSQLMTPFSRATDVLKFDYEGIGLNLYLDKVLLEQIGGDLHISSTQNKGTTVTLTIPEVKA